MNANQKGKQVSNGGNTSQSRKPGFTISELIPIKDALEALSKKQSALGYQWAKNLNLVTAEIKRSTDALSKSRISLQDKDKEGNLIEYVAKITGNTAQLETDKKGNLVIFKQGQQLKTSQTVMNRIAKENLSKWDAIEKEFNSEVHVIQWHKIPEERIEQVAKDEKLEGSLLAPLLGTIID